MNDLEQRMFVTCPAGEAKLRLPDFRRAQLALRAPVMLPALETEIVLQRDVIVTVSTDDEAVEGLRVAWEPAGGGPFPRFAGKLRIESDEPERCCLVLEGTCGPPAANTVRDSDLALSHRILVSTARTFLREIRSSLERSHRESERQKRSSP